MVDTWLKTPQDELIPLMKHMFDYTIHAILFAVYDFNYDDEHLVSSVHDSYKVVSFLLIYYFICFPVISISDTLLNLFQYTDIGLHHRDRWIACRLSVR